MLPVIKQVATAAPADAVDLKPPGHMHKPWPGSARRRQGMKAAKKA